MVTKVINIEVRDGDLNDLNNDLNKVEKNFKDVERSADKTSAGLKDVGKNGGAIAVLDELTGGLATKTRDVAEATELFNFKLKGTRTALIATGIGAFVVALGVVVAYWEEIGDLITGSNAFLEKQNELLEQNIGLGEDKIKSLELEKQLLELQGKSTEGVKKQIAEQLALIRAQNQDLIKAAEIKLKNAKAVEAEASWWEQILYFRDPALRAVADAKAEQERQATILSLEKELELLKAKDKQIELTQFKAANPTVSGGSGGTRTQVAGIEALTGAQAQQIETAGIVSNIIQNIDANDTEFARMQADARVEIARLEAEQKQEALEGYANSLMAISGVIGQETAAGKALAVAASLINTYAAIAGQLKAFSGVPIPGYAIAQAIATGAVGFANVQKILSVQVPSFGGGFAVGGGNRVDTGGQSAPSFNVVGTSGVNQLAESLQQDNEPIQAYVVANNVTTAQSLNNNIVETASIG